MRTKQARAVQVRLAVFGRGEVPSQRSLRVGRPVVVIEREERERERKKKRDHGLYREEQLNIARENKKVYPNEHPRPVPVGINYAPKRTGQPALSRLKNSDSGSGSSSTQCTPTPFIPTHSPSTQQANRTLSTAV